MSSVISKGLVFAMEDDAELTPPAAVEMVPESAAEVETAAAEVTEQVGEVETMDTAVASAETDADTLGDIQEVLQEGVDSGEGVPESTAEVAEIAIESIRERLGMKRKNPASIMPAMESFGSKGSRLAATKIALEGVMDTIKTIWANIMKALKWVWEKIKSFFLALTKNRAMLLKHLEGLQARVKAFDGQAGKAVTGGSVKAFSIGGKADFSTAEKVLKDSAGLLASIGASSATAKNLVNKLTGGSAEEMTGAGEELVTGLTKAFQQHMGQVNSDKKGAEGSVAHHYGNLVGGKSVAITSSDKEATLSVQLEDTGAAAAKEAAALDKGQMETLVATSIALVKSLQGYDKIEKDLEAVTKACQSVADAVMKGKINTTEDKDEAGKLKKAAANVRALNSMVAKFGSSCPSAVFSAAKAGGDYVTASMAAAGKKEEKKPEDKKE